MHVIILHIYNVFLSVFCECFSGESSVYSITVMCQKCEVNCRFSDFVDLTLLNIAIIYNIAIV